MAEVCGAGNPDVPNAFACEYPPGHDRIWRYGAWYDHGAPTQTVWWVVPPFSEDEAALVKRVVEHIVSSPYVEELLEQELSAHGWTLTRVLPRPGGPATQPDMEALTRGNHAAPVDHPEYRARGYSVLEPIDHPEFRGAAGYTIYPEGTPM